MSVILAIHGNPGAPEDFAHITARVESAHVRVVTPEIFYERDGVAGLVAQLDRAVSASESEPLLLVGYSWGAWVALHYARAGAREPAAIILINPYVVPTNPMSAAVSGLAAVPVLGRALLQCATGPLTDAYLSDVFSPGAPPDSLATAWSKRLASPDPWVAAIRRKRGHQRNPLSRIERLSCPALVLVGSDDRVACWAEQRAPLLEVLEHVEVREIEGAGHSLLWTHQDEVMAAIEPWISQEDGS